MPFQPIPNGIKIEFNALQNGIPIVNVFHVVMGTTVDDTALQEVTDAALVWYDEDLRGGLSSSYVLQNVTATNMSVENGHQYINTSIANPAGAVAGAAAAANAALCVSWRTVNTGRSFRGRTYFGGLPQSALANAQTFDTTYAAGYSAAAFNLIDVLEAIGATLVVVSRVANGIQRITALATEIIGVIVDNKVDSQRRRTAN